MEKEMDHGPNIKTKQDGAFKYKQQVGLLLFGVYCIIYVSFIVINVAFPKLMGIPVLFGVNLAVIYGFSLIIIALVMGLFYNILCSKAEAKAGKSEGGPA
jgi:uncharacterized membrane protein (DUF485 family)